MLTYGNSYSDRSRGTRRHRALSLSFLLFTTALLTLLAVPAVSAAAQTREVGGPGATDAGNCVTAPCATIGYAIGQASAGDTIDVAAGHYETPLTIAKQLTIQGDIAGGTEIGPTQTTGIVAGSTITLAAGASGTVLRDLEVRSRAQSQAAIATSGGPVDDVTIERVDQHGIGPSTPPTTVAPGLQISVPAAGWKVIDSSFEADYQGILVSGDASDMTVEGSSFDHDRSGFYVARSTPLSPSSTGTIEGLELSDCEFVEDEYRGLYFEGLSEATIEDITVTGTGKGFVGPPFGSGGLALNLKAGDYGQILIVGATITGSLNEGMTIQVRGYPGDATYEGQAAASLDSVEVTESTITGNGGPGIAITNELNLGEATVSDSRIVGNGLKDLITGHDVSASGIWALNEAPGAPTVAAADNWFGCNAGPAVTVAGCDGVDATVIASPWLVLSGTAQVPALTLGASTAVRAAIDTDSAGNPSGVAPAGTPVVFATAAGTIAPAATALVGGEARATYTASTVGAAGLTATVDHQSIAVPLTVSAPLPPAEETKPVEEAKPVEETKPAPASAPTPSPAPQSRIESTETKTPTAVTSSGTVTVATIGCASSSCEVEASKPSIKVGGKSFPIKVKLPATIAGGASAPIRVVLSRKAREALAEKGKGKIQLKVTVTAADGTTKTVTVTLIVKPKKEGKK